MNTLALIFLFTALLCLIIAAIPFGPFQLTLKIVEKINGKQTIAGSSTHDNPSCAILLCAYNEEEVIENKISNMLAMRQYTDQLDILVYDDGSSDATLDILKRYQSDITVVHSLGRHGKPWGMNKLVSMTDADIVLFTDANVHVEPECIERIKWYFSDPAIGCLTSNLMYTNPDDSGTAQTGDAYWRLDDWTKELETNTGSAMGADGSFYAIRRHLYSDCPDHMIDDLHTSMSILCQGYRVIRADDVKSYELHATNTLDEFGRKVRIACQCIAVHRQLWPKLRNLPKLDKYKYICHRYLRWLSGFFLGLSAIFAALCLSTMVGFGVCLVLVIAALAGLGIGVLADVRIAQIIYNVLVAFAGTSLGVLKSYFGTPVVTWDVAESARSSG